MNAFSNFKMIFNHSHFLSRYPLLQMYENSEQGPNHYQLLNVPRTAAIPTIKKAYRGLSLELHPDKNKAPDAAEQFRKVNKAFATISDREKRREYNRLGEHGVAVSAQQVIDHRYIMIQLIVYYCSSAIFAFMMTFTEPTGDAFSLTIFGLFGKLVEVACARISLLLIG